MFDPDSRYAALPTYPITTADGRVIMIVPVPDAPADGLLGYHLRHQGERIDHLAYAYLGQGPQYWRICELADVMTPDALAEAREIPIPPKPRT